jgi:signal peptidase I
MRRVNLAAPQSRAGGAKGVRPRRAGLRPDTAPAVRGTLTYTAGLVSKRPLGCLFEIVETLVLTLIIFFVIQTFVAQPYRVEQVSMERTLEPDQYVLVDKLTPRFDDYKRGDIVIFDPPANWAGGRGTPYIKRIIGIPGDALEVRDGLVYVNGIALQEPYLYDGQPTVATGGEDTWVIPPDQLFVMGDHRSDSADSRVFGPIPRERVIGRAWLRYFPLSTFGVLPTPTYPELAGVPGAGASSPAPGSPEASTAAP